MRVAAHPGHSLRNAQALPHTPHARVLKALQVFTEGLLKHFKTWGALR